MNKEVVMKQIDTPCRIHTGDGKFIDFDDVCSVWLDGCELHVDGDGRIQILIRDRDHMTNLEAMSMTVPIAMRDSKHNKKGRKRVRR